ncbi:DUF2971 domain-containing protein [Xanthobacter pseudotagetidis]|uniref:DUF2971 domain-containing protein n=1 Tax=Xanthobacter pseudotagetidis TaxID=3119911 RepID=UPI0037286652
MDIERAFLVKHPHVPDRLYKYRQFTEYHLDALKKDVLWLSSPDRLNDPYEAQVSFDVERFIVEDQSVDDFLKTARKARQAIEAGEDWRPSEPERPITVGDWRRQTVSTILQSSNLPEKEAFASIVEEWSKEQALAHVRSMSQQFRTGFSVLSLSATGNNKLLWAHYSNSHKGFAIEYDFASLPYGDLRRRLCFPVFYTTKLRDATRYLAKPGKPFNNLFGQYMCLVKQDDWAYEKEWRIVQAIGPEHANFEMRMPKPTAVLLGSQVSSSDEETMRHLCKDRSITLKRMVQKPGTFELEPVQVALE